MAPTDSQRLAAKMRLLVRELIAIADQANLTDDNLVALEKTLNTLGSGQLTGRMADVAASINQVAGALSLAASPNRVLEINNLREALFSLYDPGRAGSLVAGMRGMGDSDKLRAVIEARHGEAQRYLEQAAMSFTPAELEGKTVERLRDEIGARATSLRLQDAMVAKEEERRTIQAKLVEGANEEWLAQRKITSELEQSIQAARERARLIFQNRRGDLSARLEGGIAFGSTEEGRALRSPDDQNIGQILEQYKDMIGTSMGVDNLRKRMEALGITNARVTSATEELSNGVRTFGFAIDRQDGSVARATVRLDRFGNVMRDTGNRFRSFSSAISNNLIKVVQWGIATGVVYGAMQGFRQVMEQIIEIETQLANVQVILGKNTGDLNTVFKEAAEVADITSTSIKGVIGGYTLAYQAAGAFEDPTLRAAAANSLLTESMILATLSGIDQTVAMDTLVGALRQTGMELTSGRELLDRWVAVSRESNVSLNTLAQTYAIVGATAKGLGLTFEQLNALTATLAEATGLSATETGNAIRGIVAGFQSAQAEKVLDRFGIETRKATGELRDFWSLLNEVSELLSSGAISPAELTEIANAIGGGYRRGAQVQTILEGMARAQQLVNVQLNASGEAGDALETKMQTLSAAITRLGNAFTNLAQTLGEEGGFLWVAKGIVEILTLFVDTLENLTRGLGKATPVMLTFGAAWLALQSGQGQKLLGGAAGGLLTGAARRFAPEGSNLIQDRLGGQYGFPPAGYTRGGAAGAVRGGMQRRMGGIDPLSAGIAVLPGLLTAISALGEETEDKPERLQKAGAQIAGGIAGALIGGPVGAVIGSAIGGAFADYVIDEERDIGTRLAEHFIESAKDVGDAGPTVDEDLPPGEQLTQLAQQLPQAAQTMADYVAAILSVREFILAEGGSKAFQAPEKAIESSDLLLAAIYQKVGEELPRTLAERLGTLDIGVIAADIVPKINDEDVEGAADLIDQMFEQMLEDVDIAGPLRKAIEAGTPGMELAASNLVEKFKAEAQRQFILGDIDISDMITVSETSAAGLADNLETLRQTLSLAGVDISVNELVDSYLDLDTASKQLLDTAANQVRTQSDLLSSYKEGSKDAEEIAAKTEDYNDALRNLSQLQTILAQRQVLAKVDERPIVDLGRLTPAQIQQVRRESDRLRDQAASAYADGSEEGATLWVEQLGDVLIRAGEGIGKEFIDEFFDQDPAYIKAAIDNLGFEDALKEAAQFGLRDLRDQLGVADFPSLMRRYEQVKGTITAQFPDYEVQEEYQGLILKDGFRTIHADMTLFNLAMQDLIDVNEQQLEGVWNLPSGMTAFVAWSSLFSRDISSGSSASFPFEGGETDPVIKAGGRATPPPTGRVFTDADVTPELQALKDRVDRLDALVDLGAREAGVGVQDYAALKEEAEVARGDYMTAFYQAVRDTNMGMAAPIGGAVGAPQTDAETIVQGFQEAFQLENKIELNASIRLVVDGRTLANVVKQYLFTDLVQATDRSMGGGGGYVIEAE